MFQTALFPEVEIPEEELNRRLSPYYPKLWDIVNHPFEDLKRRRASDAGFRVLDEGESAQWLRPQIIERARHTFRDDDSVSVIKRRNQYYLAFGDDFLVVPKKLRREHLRNRLTFSSYNTNQNSKFWLQQEIEGLPDLPRLIIGYLFIREMTEIQTWVAYPRGKSDGLYILVPDQGGVIGLAASEVDDDRFDEDLGFQVKPKRKALPETG